MDDRGTARERDATDRSSSPESPADREIDEVGDESFPASDPPQWWSGGSPGDDAEDE